MADVYRKFLHNGPRTEETDKIADELARHAVLDTWPDAEGIEIWWIQNRGEWFVYASATIPDKEGTT